MGRAPLIKPEIKSSQKAAACGSRERTCAISKFQYFETYVRLYYNPDVREARSGWYEKSPRTFQKEYKRPIEGFSPGGGWVLLMLLGVVNGI